MAAFIFKLAVGTRKAIFSSGPAVYIRCSDSDGSDKICLLFVRLSCLLQNLFPFETVAFERAFMSRHNYKAGIIL